MDPEEHEASGLTAKIPGVPLPPLYSCHFCGDAINMKSVNTLRLVSAWAPLSAKTVKRVEQDHHKYCHEWCLPQKSEDQTLAMF